MQISKTFSRRRLTLPVIVGLLLGALSANAQVSAAGQDTSKPKDGKPDVGPLKILKFDTDEGTRTALDVSPDGKTIVFDMLGDLYLLPIEGGEARKLTSGLPWDEQPRWSPDGIEIAFLSDRSGAIATWVMKADGTGARQISGSTTAPIWIKEGISVVVSGGIAISRFGGGGFPLAAPGKLSSYGGLTFSPDERYVYSGGNLSRFDRVTNETVPLISGFGAAQDPLMSPDGKWLAYGRKVDANTQLRIRDMTTGAERTLAPRISNDMMGYAFTPDSRNVVISFGGKIHKVEVATGDDRVIPMTVHVELEIAERIRNPRRIPADSVVARVIRWPRVSPNGRQLVFSALAKLWIMDLPNGAPRRLTTSPDGEYAPAWSADGRSIAYTTWTDSLSGGHLRVIGPEGGASRAVTTVPGQYLNPAWSPDGKTISYVVGNPVSEQIAWQPDEQLPYQIRLIPSAGGESRLLAYTRPYHWSQRAHPMPVFSPDGTRLIYADLEEQFGGKHAIVSLSLDGKDRTVIYRVNPGDEVIPSPDGTRLAIWRSENFFVVPVPKFPTGADVAPGGGPVPSVKITRDGADWGAWLDDSTFVYCAATKLFKRSLGRGIPVDTTARPTLLADVRLVVPRAQPAGTIAFTNARIVTMRGDTVIENGTIVATGERITAVGPTGSVAIPAGATVIDATGKTIIPGLHDSHAHVQFNSYGTYPEQKWSFIINLAYGVTTVMDPWAPTHEVFEQRDMVDAGMMLGPRMYSTGDQVDGRIETLAQYVSIGSLDDARQIVRRLKSFGADMMKEYMQPRRDQRQWLAEAAREEGLLVTAEGGGDLVHDLTMVVDGYTAFEHTVPVAPLYRDVIQLLAQSQVFYTPTFIVAYGGPSLFDYYTARTNPHDDPKVRRFTPEPRVDDGRHWNFYPDDELHYKFLSQDAHKITLAGGKVALGSHGNQQGIGAHWELWGHVDGGASPLEAIRNATVRPAEKIGYDRDLGSLEPGMLADFLVLDANPLEDIHNSLKIRWVIKGGMVYDAESMTQVWPVRRPLHRFFWQTEEEWRRFAAKDPAALR